jgi:hypothetical protein
MRKIEKCHTFSVQALLFEDQRNEEKNLKRNEAKKLVFRFRLSKRKISETDPISLLFASKRKKYLSETGAP